MKPSFHHRLINGRFEDPCLYVRLMWESRALLFDLGNISRLRQAELQKVTDIFVTHTHIDHFIGFDTVLRAALRRDVPLRIYGPSPIADCIEGKLKGYTWNLIKEYPLKLEVFSVTESEIRHFSFHAAEGFKRSFAGLRPFGGVLLEEASFSVRAEILNHDIQCLGYCLEEQTHINIDKAALSSMGLPVGPWLSGLKKAVREDLPEETPIEAGGKRYPLGLLKEKLVIVADGQKIAYVVDSSPEESNLRKIVSLSRGADTLYSEAYFLQADMERAVSRNHLTALIAGKTARRAGVKNLVVMHFSPIYKNLPYTPEQEAMEAFADGG